jgi:hypothetical protein
MSADDLETANQFLEALAIAAETGDRNHLLPLLADDVEWVNPKRTLRGIDEVVSDLNWLHAPDNLDVEFKRGEMTDLRDGRIMLDVHETYRLRESGDFAYERDLRIELTIRSKEVARYEIRVVE